MNNLITIPRLYRQLIAAAADCLLLSLAFYSAVLLRYDGMDATLLNLYGWMIVAAPLISVPIFIKLGLYRAVVRFIDQKILTVVIIGVTLTVMCMSVLVVALHTVGYSRGVLGIYWVSAILYVVSSRFLARSYFLRIIGGQHGSVRVVLYGAGQAGSQLAATLSLHSVYAPVAFIDDNPELHGRTIAGIKVYRPSQLPTLVDKESIEIVLLAIPSLSRAGQRRILERLEPLKIKTLMAPTLSSLISGAARLQDVREIEVEDLLGRDSVAPDERLMATCVTGKTVLVTGAGGSIGSELCRQIIQRRPARLLLLEMSEYALYTIERELAELQAGIVGGVDVVPFLGSVLDRSRCERILTAYPVDTVYHAAAYKHVPLVEHNPIEGVRNNVFGTRTMAEAAVAAGVKNFVLISTDKAVRPTNVMGSTKRLAELILQALARQQSGTRFCMVRFGNVLGSSGSVVPLFRKQILAGGPITLTHPEITRYFMTITEAAQLVIQAASMATGGDVFVLDMGEPVKIIDLARRMVHLSGLEVKTDLTPAGTVEIQHVGLRPGEKLYEELLIGSNVEGTNHPLILRAQESEIAWPVLCDLLDSLEAACANFDHQRVRAAIQSVVREYAPQGEIEDFLWQLHQPQRAAPAKSTLH